VTSIMLLPAVSATDKPVTEHWLPEVALQVAAVAVPPIFKVTVVPACEAPVGVLAVAFELKTTYMAVTVPDKGEATERFFLPNA
jgi:hypothetical protein